MVAGLDRLIVTEMNRAAGRLGTPPRSPGDCQGIRCTPAPPRAFTYPDMSWTTFLSATLLTVTPLAAQLVSVNDVGLTMDGGILPVIYGQSCGPFTCTPFQAGPVGAGLPYNISVHGAPGQAFVLAIDLVPFPCIAFPGIGNALLVAQPVTLALGIAVANPTAACRQGRGVHVLQTPPATPPGIQFLLQGGAFSPSLGIPAFTVALQSRTV